MLFINLNKTRQYGKGGDGHFTSWKFACLYLENGHELFRFVLKMIRNILTPLCLKFEMSAYAQTAIIRYFILFTNFLTSYDMNLKLTLVLLFD